MADREPDVAIVGAGIVGVACAEACAAEGLRVLVIDRGRLASGTTGAGTGHLVSLVESEATFALTAYSQRLWHARAHELPDDVGFRPCGAVWLGRTDEEAAGLDRLHQLYRGRGVPSTRLDSPALHREEPALAPVVTAGLLVPGDAVLDPSAATRYLWWEAQRQGAELIENEPVVALKAPQLTLGSGKIVRARTIVIAAGVDSPSLVPELPIRPRKGHLVRLAAPSDLVRHQLLEIGYLQSVRDDSSDSIAFNAQPLTTGKVVVGSSRQYGETAVAPDLAVIQRMLKRACEFLPSIAAHSVEAQWAGLRPSSPDHLPFIGPLPERPGVLIAAGHEGIGVTTALATGRLIADFVAERQSAISPDPYLPVGRTARSSNRLAVSRPARTKNRGKRSEPRRPRPGGRR